MSTKDRDLTLTVLVSKLTPPPPPPAGDSQARPTNNHKVISYLGLGRVDGESRLETAAEPKIPRAALPEAERYPGLAGP